jgi:hypothetical protein
MPNESWLDMEATEDRGAFFVNMVLEEAEEDSQILE